MTSQQSVRIEFAYTFAYTGSAVRPVRMIFGAGVPGGRKIRRDRKAVPGKRRYVFV